MRYINKDFTKTPAVLKNKGTDERNGSLLQIQKGINTNKGGHYSSYQNVYDALKTLYHNKCAYCEEKVIKERDLEKEITERKKDATIDHYRPKDAGYYWLGNEWSNLLFACATCNEANKKTLFPIKSTKANLSLPFSIFDSNGDFEESNFTSDSSVFRADKRFLLSEEPLLLHPEIDNPQEHLSFDSWGRIIYLTERGQKTIEILKLDRFDDDRNAIITEIISFLQALSYELTKNEIDIDKYKKDLQKVFCEKILLKQAMKYEFSFWYQYLSNNFQECILDVLDAKYSFSGQEIEYLKIIFDECKNVVNDKLK